MVEATQGKSPDRKEVVLRVHEALPSHVGRGIVAIDMKTKQELGLSSGDIVEIEGKKITAAIVWPSRVEDEGKGIIHMDSIIRSNAGVSIGDKVVVRRASWKNAEKITLAPASENEVIIRGYENYLLKHFMGRPFVKGDKVVVPFFRKSVYVVVSTKPSGIVRVSPQTEIVVLDKPVKTGNVPNITYDDIGGLRDQVQKIREMIEIPLKHPELFHRLGIEPPKGVLLYGPPGTGKTLLAKAVANETNAYFIPINGPEIMSKFVGEAEERLRKVFEEAQENAPAIIFIDEIDAIAPKREDVLGEVERRVVAQLLTLMDGLESRGDVVVIAATNRPNAIDPALRRPGRFDREIELPVPDRQSRKEILQIHTRNVPLAKDVDLDWLADVTHGFVGADLAALVKEAAMKALRRILPDIDLDQEELPAEVLDRLQVTRRDFEEALKEVKPSALREVFVEVPSIHWDDVGGLENVKRLLAESVELPLKKRESFEAMGIKPPRGILLYGPPGTGKTLLAKAVATESEANFISVKGPEILSKWVGESEKAIREIFTKARQAAPCVVFIDEIDAIAPRRGGDDTHVTDRIVNQLLTEMDGISELKDVVVIAATNRPDIIDPSLLRPGRFDRVIYVPPPDRDARLEILRVHTKGVPLAEDVDLSVLADETEGYTGADLAALVREAALVALRRNNMEPTRVTLQDFREAMNTIGPSLDKDTVAFYEAFSKLLSQKVVKRIVSKKSSTPDYFG
ncbi:MAG: CDC48 family AAA ATPase [Candidatus Diapherotrites archaeon]|nr:CDC48 family AAA ATPase [Candidatus Diapherotrites archaeon]